MYSYSYDFETGGILLNSANTFNFKEPRPVYYQEMDLLGFNKYWQYEKNDSAPYLWSESGRYYYRGKEIAQIRGGNLFEKPRLILVEKADHSTFQQVNIPLMIKKNEKILKSLVEETIRKVYNTYVKYQQRIDLFYVAYSGGKDSEVTLDIVQRALPHTAFKVIFGDTGMEFPDTYKAIHQTEIICNSRNIDFIRTSSEFEPHETWRMFGSPASVNRWCCSVHKTAPQILTIRKILGKDRFTGMAFIGVRRSESKARSEYKYLSVGKKHKGQYSCNPILDWNSAELYLYMYANHLPLNEAYKKGNHRVGCLLCPRATEKSEYITRTCYPKEVNSYLEIIRDLYRTSIPESEQMKQFLGNGGWKARKNGRDFAIDIGYSERKENDVQILTVKNPKVDWKIWIKTIGVLVSNESPYEIVFRGERYTFRVEPTQNGYNVIFSNDLLKQKPIFVKLLKNVFRKSACCIGCHECEADCHNGCMQMINGHLSISDNCIHCAECHKVTNGCLVYKSLAMPKGGLLMSQKKSLNCYSHHAPKIEWFRQFFEYKNEFDNKHSLGSQMFSFFKRFLRDAELLDKNGFSDTAKIIDANGLDNLSSWGIMLTNLSYTPEINWFIKKIPMNEIVNRDYVLALLITDGAKESWVGDIWNAFGRFIELPFSEVGMGVGIKEKNRLLAIKRTPWNNPDPLVVLYALYKFAEKCDGYYEFTLSRLLNYDIDSNGVSPTEIFGIHREEMEKILNGLSVKYSGYINASFTLGLDNITLAKDKTSNDVLHLF